MTGEFEKGLRMIDAFLAGERTWSRFYEEYYGYYIDDLDLDTVSQAEHEFLYEVQERLDWTSQDPDEESRRYGTISVEEFSEWLVEWRRKWHSR